MTTNDPAWVSISQAAEHISVDQKTIRRMIARGEIEARRFGPKLLRVRLDSIATAGRVLTADDAA